MKPMVRNILIAAAAAVFLFSGVMVWKHYSLQMIMNYITQIISNNKNRPFN